MATPDKPDQQNKPNSQKRSLSKIDRLNAHIGLATLYIHHANSSMTELNDRREMMAKAKAHTSKAEVLLKSVG
jgi:hypothetical protein